MILDPLRDKQQDPFTICPRCQGEIFGAPVMNASNQFHCAECERLDESAKHKRISSLLDQLQVVGNDLSDIPDDTKESLESLLKTKIIQAERNGVRWEDAL